MSGLTHEDAKRVLAQMTPDQRARMWSRADAKGVSVEDLILESLDQIVQQIADSDDEEVQRRE